jgi:hypothetical protein
LPLEGYLVTVDVYVATIEEPLGSPQILGGVYVATIEEPLGSPQGLGEVYVATIEDPLGSPQVLGGSRPHPNPGVNPGAPQW